MAHDGITELREVRQRRQQATAQPPDVTPDDEPDYVIGDADYPAPMDDAAYHGIAGEYIRTIEPHTEADPTGMLVQLLVAFGSMVGRSPHFRVEATKHHANEYAVSVGRTSKGRKGTGTDNVTGTASVVDPTWRVTGGLSSGEGLIWAVRDPISKREPIKEKGRTTGYVEVEDDPGITDKRLLLVESEFASVLRMAQRDGNSLSPILRKAWDLDVIDSLVKSSPARATGAHISIIGHISRDELLRYCDRTEIANGLINRYLWLATKRSKLLPEGGRPNTERMARVSNRLRDVLAVAQRIGEVTRDDHARAAWRDGYADLSRDKPGLWGAVTGRAEAHVTRLSMIYALLDGSAVIRLEHHLAALAVWDYCDRSARWIWGDDTGDDVADKLLAAIQAAGDTGLSRTSLSDVLGRHAPRKRIERALSTLISAGIIRTDKVPTATGGRPTQMFYAIAKEAK